MAELVAESGILKGLSFSLTNRDEWIIGRDPEICHIVLEDPKVSREHFVIKKEDENYTIRNLSTSKPIKINDKDVVDEMILREGDKINVGGTNLRFYIERKDLEIPSHFAEEKATIFKEEEVSSLEPTLDFTIPSRFILKVIGGPNAGAEYALEPEKEYIIGSDSIRCDIVFFDLSVSREHARLFLDKEGKIFIEDLQSRNGVLINKEKAEGTRVLLPNTQVTLGTSVFMVLDREAPSVTIVSHGRDEEKVEEELAAPLKTVEEKKTPSLVSTSSLILATILGGLVILLGIGAISLFKEETIEAVPTNYQELIREAVQDFSCVSFTYTEATGNLFLVGHVSTGIEKSALLYKLQGLNFIKGLEDNVVVDDAVWQEMNLLFSKYKDFEGVSMHSPEPACFVLSGYLKTMKQKAALNDFINLNFIYLGLLENRVIVEEEVLDSVHGDLLQSGFGGVEVQFIDGQLTLTGIVSAMQSEEFQRIVDRLSNKRGVRTVRNYVVFQSPEQAVMDLNEKFPGRYVITGYSKYGDININVVINCRILMRGDVIDGMTITSIQPHMLFLEKDGLKYKLEYNK